MNHLRGDYDGWSTAVGVVRDSLRSRPSANFRPGGFLMGRNT